MVADRVFYPLVPGARSNQPFTVTWRSSTASMACCNGTSLVYARHSTCHGADACAATFFLVLASVWMICVLFNGHHAYEEYISTWSI